MADHVEQGKVQLEPLRSLSPEDATERVDALWRQIMVYKAFAESSLSEAKTRRAQAEAARDDAEQNAADATRRLYENMKSEADGVKREAEALNSEAANAMQQADAERERASNAAKQAEEAGQRIILEAKQKAQEIQDRARMGAQQEYDELRRQALKEIQAIMARVETIRAATDEEHETQRIFSNIAKLKATSPSALDHPNDDGNGSANPYHGLRPSEATAEGTEAIIQAEPAQEITQAETATTEPGKANAPAPSSEGTKRKEKKAKRA